MSDANSDEGRPTTHNIRRTIRFATYSDVYPGRDGLTSPTTRRKECR